LRRVTLPDRSAVAGSGVSSPRAGRLRLPYLAAQPREPGEGQACCVGAVAVLVDERANLAGAERSEERR